MRVTDIWMLAAAVNSHVGCVCACVCVVNMSVNSCFLLCTLSRMLTCGWCMVCYYRLCVALHTTTSTSVHIQYSIHIYDGNLFRMAVNDCCAYSYLCRLRLGEFGDGTSSVKRFTLSTKQESRPAHRIVIPEGKQSKVGCIVFSVSSHENMSTSSSLGRVIVVCNDGEWCLGTFKLHCTWFWHSKQLSDSFHVWLHYVEVFLP